MSAQAMLARREHSRLELKQKLQLRDFPLDEVELVLDKLIEKGWQSDERFCEAFIRSRVAKGQGPQKIAYNLKSRGVNNILIANEMQNYVECWLELCQTLFEKKYQGIIPENPAEKAKQYKFLSSRGFPNDIIRQIIK